MNLKILRKEKKLTQTDVAKHLHISQSNYGKYELETIEPDINTLIKLANYYDVTLDELVGRDYNNDIGHLTQQEKDIVKALLKLNEFDQAHIYGQIIGMLAKY